VAPDMHDVKLCFYSSHQMLSTHTTGKYFDLYLTALIKLLRICNME
jgi:hypothetical protein